MKLFWDHPHILFRLHSGLDYFAMFMPFVHFKDFYTLTNTIHSFAIFPDEPTEASNWSKISRICILTNPLKAPHL